MASGGIDTGDKRTLATGSTYSTATHTVASRKPSRTAAKTHGDQAIATGDTLATGTTSTGTINLGNPATTA